MLVKMLAYKESGGKVKPSSHLLPRQPLHLLPRQAKRLDSITQAVSDVDIGVVGAPLLKRHGQGGPPGGQSSSSSSISSRGARFGRPRQHKAVHVEHLAVD